MHSSLPGLFPEFHQIMWLQISQTLITSFLSLIFFLIFVVIYNYLKKKNEDSAFVALVEMLIEEMDKFFGSVSDKIPVAAKTYILFLFVYILWNNLFWLFLDMFATVIPTLHEWTRPVTTDIIFNAMLAVFGVLWAFFFGFKENGWKFLEKYIPLKGVWIVQGKPEWNLFKKILWLIIKFFDILLGLFIGFLEFVGEFTKMLSLTLRLFWNIIAWVVLLTLIVTATIALMKVPFLAPLAVFLMELLVALLQAFVFALLVAVYFKLAEETH